MTGRTGWAAALLLVCSCLEAASVKSKSPYYPWHNERNSQRSDLPAFARARQQEVEEMFMHGFDSYMQNAYPRDELRPLSCTGHDTWGPLALTLVDSLDMLYILNQRQRFRESVAITVNTLQLDIDKNVSVFETTIRILGGLLSAHMFAEEDSNNHTHWYKGELLDMALDLGTRILPAYDTPTGIPYGTVNLRYGVPPGETPISSLAAAGTSLLEFGMLSRLTGNPQFEWVARGSLRAIHALRSKIDLPGNHIDTMTGKWTLLDSGIGPNQDSFYEYLLKGYALFKDTEYLSMFEDVYFAAVALMKHGDWYMDVNMHTGAKSLPWFTALSNFWPGMQVMYGDVIAAERTMYNFAEIWRRLGFVPEAFDLNKGDYPHQLVSYFLRPEMAESLVYLYQATHDPVWLVLGEDMVRSLQMVTRTECGFAVVSNVSDHTLGDRMESFFLSETLKYLYLLFNSEHFLHKGSYIFNTEAHPFPVSALTATDRSPAQTNAPQRTGCPRRPRMSRLLAETHKRKDAQAEEKKKQDEEEKKAQRSAVTEAQLEDIKKAVIAQLSHNKDLDVGAALKQLVSTQTSINAKAAEDTDPSPPSITARLADLRAACFKAEKGFWMYEVCFGRHVRQFEKEGTVSNMLGVRHVGGLVRSARSLDDVKDAMFGLNMSLIIAGESMPHEVVHTYEDGDVCDVSGLQLPRTAVVVYRCLATAGTAVLMNVTETSLCRYHIEIQANIMCDPRVA